MKKVQKYKIKIISTYPNFFMIAPLAIVSGIPATVPIARDIPMVSFVEPKSSRNQKR